MSVETGISFCVITGGFRPDRMENLIRSIIRMEVPNYEILVCGWHPGGETDGRIDYVEKRDWAGRAEVCRMRNFNAARAKFDTIIILDDDVEFTPTWWREVRVLGDFDLAGCRGVDGNGNRWWDWQRVERGNPLSAPALLEYGETHPDAYISGYFMMMRKSVWEAVKFDESRRNYQHDDIDFCHRVTDKGYSLKVFPQATVIHHVDLRGRDESENARREFIAKNAELKSVGDEARFYLSMKEYLKAIPLYKKVAKNDPSFRTYYNLGYCYQQLGALGNAARYYLQAIEVSGSEDTPRLASAYLHLGEIFIKKGHYEYAEGSLKKALAFLPENRRAEELLDSLTGAILAR